MNQNLDPHFSLIRNVVLPDAKKQPDRGMVLVLAAVIDNELTDILTGFLVEDKKLHKKFFKGLGPLATFSAKIDLGYLLGLYHSQFQELLHSIRDVRNAFAHNMEPVSLESEEIKQLDGGLKYIDQFGSLSKQLTQRERFISACEFCLGGLTAIATEKRRLKSPQPGKKASRASS